MLFTFRGTNPLLIPTFGFQLHKNRMKGLSIYLKVCFQKLSLDMKNIILHLFWLTSIGFVLDLVLYLFWLTSIGFVLDLVLHLFWLTSIGFVRVLFCTCFDLQVSVLFSVSLCTCFELQVSALFQIVLRTQKGDYLLCFDMLIAYDTLFCLACTVHPVVDKGMWELGPGGTLNHGA